MRLHYLDIKASSDDWALMAWVTSNSALSLSLRSSFSSTSLSGVGHGVFRWVEPSTMLFLHPFGVIACTRVHLVQSPVSMKSGTRTSVPVSTVAGFKVLVYPP